ncbi:DUF1090 domain-containing protein [Erwinia sp. HR93]|uniref:DUF1090 domain-containing protein n=1 Tax=Erwinia sp. HR93 TaxID=3094840 RepID=UPI002ADEB8BB|nr:DUF1090 domain-containing protein [Erwinia sp. HR93]MEA1062471.1 DUF1090 domain-containing protein [Erwinia sp. HR93]
MKCRIALALTLISLTGVAAQAATSPCQDKAQSIQREIDYAKQHNNSHRISGLQTALKEVQDHCDNSTVLADHQKKLAHQREKIAERKDELAEAHRKGDTKKIAKREQKLAEAESELKALEAQDY